MEKWRGAELKENVPKSWGDEVGRHKLWVMKLLLLSKRDVDNIVDGRERLE